MIDMSTFIVLEAYAKLRRQVSLLGAIELKTADLGVKQMQILYELSGSPCTMGELASCTLSDKASTTRTVEALVKAGWVKRANSGDDRRKRVITLTAKGRLKAQKALEVRNSIGKRLEATLTLNERKTLVELLTKITDGLEQRK
jgi:DNA-binding MarR family transcriptional regulator